MAQIKTLTIAPDALLLIFRDGSYARPFDGISKILEIEGTLPNDTRILSTRLNHRGDLVLVLTSESFPDIGAIDLIPDWTLLRFRECDRKGSPVGI